MARDRLTGDEFKRQRGCMLTGIAMESDELTGWAGDGSMTTGSIDGWRVRGASCVL